MILSRLFNTKNKWQAKDSNLRIAAINEDLNVSNSEDKDILMSLLSKDQSDLVRRAALLKLNDFSVYLFTSQDNDSASVKQFASKQVNAILANNHEISLTTAQKQEFLQQANNQIWLTNWLEHEQDPSLIVALFKQLSQKKNTSHFLAQVFNQKQQPEVQMQLLAFELPELSDINFLTKLAKKSASASINTLINEKIAALLAEQEKPLKLHKQLQLILSKLLALKDAKDYGLYEHKRNQLEQEWQQAITDISCLASEAQHTLLEKYQTIINQLTKLFVGKAEAYQQEKIKQQLQQQKQALKTKFRTAIDDLSLLISNAVFENEALDQTQYSEQLTNLQEAISDSILSQEEQAIFTEQVAVLAKRLTQLPEIAESVTQATHLISKMSQLSLPQTLDELNDRQNIYNHWLKEWREVQTKSTGVLPQSINNAHKEITQKWSKGLKPLQAEQKKLFIQTKKKLIDIKRLVNNGKYKVCFGLFKGVNEVFALLSHHQQQQLQRDYEQVNEKIAELSDWEHYIATPRKQQLLEEILRLGQAPLDNPNEQAEKVKQYRKIWNSLGHADEDVDHALNEQFNQACEQAFAPCRLFYAEQEALRTKHLHERHDIIHQAEQIATAFLTQQAEQAPENQQSNKSLASHFKEIDAQLNKLQQRWNQAGDVDRKEYQQLQHKFKQVLAPLKAAITAFHKANSEQKSTLITQAQQQLSNDDIFAAIEQVKQLQQQWRAIGFAGSRQENKLWQEFRQINDQIFAKREQIKNQHQAEQVELVEQYSERLAQIQSQLSKQVEKPSLGQAQQDAQDLLVQVLAKKPVIKKVATAIELFIKDCQQQLTAISAQEQRVSWQGLFALLNKLAQTTNAIELEQLITDNDFTLISHFWQKRLQDHIVKAKPADHAQRLVKTLTIEILAQVESPAEFSQQRMAVQVELMQEQMLSGQGINLNEQLAQWLSLGTLTEDDLTLLARLQPIFVQ